MEEKGKWNKEMALDVPFVPGVSICPDIQLQTMSTRNSHSSHIIIFTVLYYKYPSNSPGQILQPALHKGLSLYH